MQIYTSIVLKIIENDCAFLIRKRKHGDYIVMDESSLEIFIMEDIDLMEFFPNLNNHHLSKLNI
jgi:hypothetical protein